VAEATPGLASGVSVDVADEKPAPEPKQQKIDLPRPDYRVQLGSHRTASAAIRDWQRIEKLSEGFLAGLIPEVAEVDMKRRGTWHRLQVPVPEGHIAARNLCDNLADLSVSCLVVRRRDS
jgi:hypothetical protein